MSIPSQRIGLIATLVIPEGEQNSEFLVGDEFSFIRGMGIASANTSLTGTVVVQALFATDLDETNDANWSTIQFPSGRDFELKAQKTAIFLGLPCPAIRLHSNKAQKATRTFHIHGQRGT